MRASMSTLEKKGETVAKTKKSTKHGIAYRI